MKTGEVVYQYKQDLLLYARDVERTAPVELLHVTLPAKLYLSRVAGITQVMSTDVTLLV